jgi:predicted phosphodiesterase
MKIQLMSDLHFEFGWMKVFKEKKLDTILVLAGDIDNRKENLDAFIDHACENFKAVIMVAGNHEFYGHDLDGMMGFLYNLDAEIDNFHFLENDFIKIDDVTFIGATLWSEPEWGVFHRINDAHMITYKNHRLLDRNIAEFSRASKVYIKDALDKIEGKKVVVTHFGPDQALMNHRWKSMGGLNTYFWASGLQDYFHKADMWLFGHTHDPQDMMLDGCRCVCNPHGYVWPDGGKEHNNFNNNLILEI